MSTNQGAWRWGRSGLAAFLAFFFLAVVLPNAGRVVIDRSTEPPKTHIVWVTPASVSFCAMAVIPVCCVLAGAFSRRRTMETIGWVLLVGVLVLMIISYTKM